MTLPVPEFVDGVRVHQQLNNTESNVTPIILIISFKEISELFNLHDLLPRAGTSVTKIKSILSPEMRNEVAMDEVK